MLSTGGIALNTLQQQIQDTKRENAMLKETIFSQSSFGYIAQKAEEKGFTPDKSAAVVISRDAGPLALNR